MFLTNPVYTVESARTVWILSIHCALRNMQLCVAEQGVGSVTLLPAVGQLARPERNTELARPQLQPHRPIQINPDHNPRPKVDLHCPSTERATHVTVMGG